MKNRGKREVIEAFNNGEKIDGFGESFVEFPCKKHPTSSSNSSGGICAYCLTDRLYELICPNCGEQRLSSCSCFDLLSSNNRNSTSSSVGSVGRISFLLENDKVNNNNVEVSSSSSKAKMDDFASLLRRSNSTCVGSTTIGRKESKEKFWKIGRLFRKKRDKTNNNNDPENSNYECNGVSRSRSLCSFRGFYDNEESGNFHNSSSNARASSVSTSNFFLDSAKRSCFSESEARISNFDYIDANGFNKNYTNNNIFSLKESEFMSCDDPSYIDLKLNDMTSDHQNNKGIDLGALRRSGLNMSTKEFSFRGNEHVLGHEMFRNNGSCRRSSVTERELRKCRKSYKVWRWFFRHHTNSRENVEDHHHGFNS